MKKMKRILAYFLAVLMTLSCIVVVSVVPAVAYTINASESVYNASAAKTLPTPVNNVYTINTANEFMAFANALNGGNNFAGKTIKLNCDVVINPGAYGTWGGSPIAWNGFGGSWGNRFAGNFDGQGHTISGIYNVKDNSAGLFGRAASGTEFKNVNIVNSYFESNTAAKGVGAVFGTLDAGATGNVLTTTISNVHVEATIVASAGATGVGGIVGETSLFDNSTLIIRNCSYKGTITASSSSSVGGIIGNMKAGADLMLKNCMADATITCGNEAAGLAGRVVACNVMISNCLAKGSITANTSSGTCRFGGTDYPKYTTGSIIGFIESNSESVTAQISNVLTAMNCNSHEALIATIKGTSGSYTVTFKLENIIYDSTYPPISTCYVRRDNGNSIYAKVNDSSSINGANWELNGSHATGQIANSYFDTTGKATSALQGYRVFDFWNINADDYPTPPEVSAVSVYNPSAANTLPTPVNNVYTITTANELMAFANTLNGGNNFSGKTIKLACDVVINQGAYGTWASPIAWSGNGGSWTNRFAGSFDGQGHTISGIYNVNGNNAGLFGRVATGAEFKNVNIVNSYFESNGDDSGVQGLGALIGSLDSGSADQVKTTTISNVHVESTKLYAPTGRTGVGGIVGATANFNNSTLIIENCSFSGTIEARKDSAKSSCVGGIVGFMKRGAKLGIENSVVNATINCGNEAAGLVGRFESCYALTISNCFAKGTINANSACTNGNTMYRTGALIGIIDLWSGVDAAVQISNVLAAVNCNSHEALIATIRGDNNARTVTFTLNDIVYDSTVQSPAGLIRRDNWPAPKASVNGASTIHGTNWNLEGQYASNSISVDFKTTAKTSAEIKGDDVFDSWIAVSGDYPRPDARSFDELKVMAFKNYGKPTAILAYQTKHEGGKYYVRLIATVTYGSGDPFVAAGFQDLSATVGGTPKTIYRYYCKRAYKSIKGGGMEYDAINYLADYFICLEIESSSSITHVEAKPFIATTSSAARVLGNSISVDISW